MPLREYRPLTREADVTQKGELRIAYYIICEGQNTEWLYFTCLCNNKREIGIHNAVEIIPLEKTDMHKGWSHPQKLFELARHKKKELKKDEYSSYEEDDKFVIVFDLDIYNGKDGKEYKALLKDIEDDEIVVVTNPCFEMWLLLHEENAYAKHISGDEERILQNKKTSKKHSYVSGKVSDVLEFNTKGSGKRKSGNNSQAYFKFKSLLESTDIAVNEEKHICEDAETMANSIGCNVGLFITELRKKRFEQR